MNKQVIESICETIADYRKGDLAARTPDDVIRWVKQFARDVRDPLLVELDHVLKHTYISLSDAKRFLDDLVLNKKLVGDDPEVFWADTELLEIQDGGNSQHDMLALFAHVLDDKLGIDAEECSGVNNTFVYLDDGVFSGNRVLHDLRDWLDADAPDAGDVHVIAMVVHSGGRYYAHELLKKKAKAVGKNIMFHWWRALALEDRRYYTRDSDVLRPNALPDDNAVQEYVESLTELGFPPNLRQGSSRGGVELFSSHEGRVLLEQQLLIAGAHIKQDCPLLPNNVRPLGYTVLKTLGFGAMIVTYRNCPNNCPLALWAGDPWIPLFPRRVNQPRINWDWDSIEL